MSVTVAIQSAVIKSLEELYQQKFDAGSFQVNQTKPEFEGDYTVVLFSILKPLRKSPEALGRELGAHLIRENAELFSGYNVIKGFLNLLVKTEFWTEFLDNNYYKESFGKKKKLSGETIMVEYSSPNTNKPLHLGHLRNNFLGWSTAEILEAAGNKVVKTCVVNDRGVHICKSMLAWQKFGNGATPSSTGIKGDHLVGDYYVLFESELKKQSEPIYLDFLKGNLNGLPEDDKNKLAALLKNLEQPTNEEKKEEILDEVREMARKQSPLMQEVREMLIKWEQHDPATINLWKNMNGWVYEGFDATYKRIGVDFDKIYYESDTYLLGKKYVEEGLAKGIFYRKEDGSVWIDLTNDGLDEKLLLRKDGTSVYITQDLGLAKLKYDDYQPDQSIYVIGDEQNYHMKVVKLIAEKLGLPKSEGIYHLGYGMVELPSGKMKSREGTVVDADDLVDEMIAEAKKKTAEQGKIEGFTTEELDRLYEMIGLGGLKFFLLKVDPKKKMVFNPEESIDLHGFTAAFIQYAHARIQSILRKDSPDKNYSSHNNDQLFELEKSLLILLEQYPVMIDQAAREHNPSVIANYCFQLAQTFNSFYSKHSVANAESENKKQLRLRICMMTALTISSSMKLLGIDVPNRM